MRLGYTVRASRSIVLHPVQGTERIRGRIDRHHDRRELAALDAPVTDVYGATATAVARLHGALRLPWPCPEEAAFGPVWNRITADLRRAGVRVGLASYGGWNDSDATFAAAIWCLVAHLQPEHVVETGVAHGLTSRCILEGLQRNGTGRLWSIDLPAVDPALHDQIGIAVPDSLRGRWTYLAGTSREQLPALLARLGDIGFFVHDSLHTGRNTSFELGAAWPALQPGGAVMVDDVDHSLAFREFVQRARPGTWLAGRHVTGHGLWGAAIKAA
jgi:hypothetical protein